jgi:hypothetical protein
MPVIDRARVFANAELDQVTLGTVDEAQGYESMPPARKKDLRCRGYPSTRRSFVMNKLAIGLSLFAALAVQSANAGLHYPVPIVVSNPVAYGSVHSARYSSDNRQFIGCAAYGSTSSSTTYVACSAQDASGHSLYCATYNPSYYVWQAAMHVNDSSEIIFNVDSNYNCTYIYISNSSANL